MTGISCMRSAIEVRAERSAWDQTPQRLYAAIAIGSVLAGLTSGWIGRVRRQGVALVLAVIGLVMRKRAAAGGSPAFGISSFSQKVQTSPTTAIVLCAALAPCPRLACPVGSFAAIDFPMRWLPLHIQYVNDSFSREKPDSYLEDG